MRGRHCTLRTFATRADTPSGALVDYPAYSFRNGSPAPKHLTRFQALFRLYRRSCIDFRQNGIRVRCSGDGHRRHFGGTASVVIMMPHSDLWPSVLLRSAEPIGAIGSKPNLHRSDTPRRFSPEAIPVVPAVGGAESAGDQRDPGQARTSR